MMSAPLSRRAAPGSVRVVHLTCAAAVLGIAVILLLPRNIGMWDAYPIVQLDALPGLWIMVLLACTVMTGVMASSTPSVARRSRIASHILLVLLICVVLIEVTLFTRAGGTLSAGLATVAAEEEDVTVLSFNARGTYSADIVGAVMESSADAILLVETNNAVAAQTSDRLRNGGLGNQLFMGTGTALGGKEEVAIIVTDHLGDYHEAPGPALAFGSLTIAPKGRGGVFASGLEIRAPTLSAVHPPAPLPGEVASSEWRHELQMAVDACSQPGAIVGGDFNASSAQISHVLSPECVDAGAYLDRGAVGTWPSVAPAPLGASIDHQLTTGNHWEPVGIRFLDVGPSDHRAVAVSYRLVGS